MDDVWLRGIMVGAAGVLALFSLGGGAAALLSGQAQPAADLLGGRAGSVRSRGRRALALGITWSVVVVLAAILERPTWVQLAFWVALAAGWVVRGAYDRHHGSRGSELPDAPRTSSDAVRLQRQEVVTDRPRGVEPPA